MNATTRHFAVIAFDRPGMREQRLALRAGHRAYLRAPEPHRVTVCLGGPLLDEVGMCGTLLVVEADTRGAVERFVQDDPYARADLFERVDIRPWQWGLGNPDVPA
ncbi:YciI family protein [Lysobacter sp.]|uniref:YciI family protein n=1 Tax=Lysobacter sp. TaxID=72226 RepID=UPI002D5030C6|nr:YciI family protein [Lysobacter sp.]HZX77304.1 YciI family protein [Lysobacter sp.]